MRVVIQRVKRAKVVTNDKVVGEINQGLLLLVGFTDNDSLKDIEYMVNKIINLRIFDDGAGVMNLSVADINGSILSVSQFTLYASIKKGRRPSYEQSLNRNEALILYQLFNKKLKDTNLHIETGAYGEEMEVKLINDGPVTIIIDSKDSSNN
ncbi:MAG: D-aminoacyl-tRNA deacylase [Bacilli bacterium]|nr:D-aminoacyl-tRNA deacylase [Bacilli bacterium]